MAEHAKKAMIEEVHPPRWPETCKDEVEAILRRYPEGRERSAILPLLHLAMREREGRYIAQSDIEAVAEICGVAPSYVQSVCSFYTMFRRQPVGKYLITVCGNMACHLLAGGSQLVEHMEKTLGIKVGETTPDGLITLEVTGECLAACDLAPVIHVDTEYVVKVTREKFDALVAALRAGEGPDRFLEKLPLMNGESQDEWPGFVDAGTPAPAAAGPAAEGSPDPSAPGAAAQAPPAESGGTAPPYQVVDGAARPSADGSAPDAPADGGASQAADAGSGPAEGE
ncbi:complex I 24 kDa subunit family protein [Symbiobacterium thermophilum]|uniref:NADH-quinone oxidoreductase subunit NuoE n=1 Tax=Symbiobacterium thermophilum TaxID=2734 RepID=A0A953IA63_SYMTR|nr:NAD(P)H-dependent oxidoreductase subunit E [Symbiobacterium thermophilum]MBY6277288.1 NADH-quinone oxidoreductase subunit NuoE [Symbiobacterium thermophilum]